MSTHGSRFSGGYQFPATDSASLTRGRPIERATGTIPPTTTWELVTVQLKGSRRDDLYCLTLTHRDLGPGGAAGVMALNVVGERDIRSAFLAAREVLRDARSVPEELPVPPGVQLL